MHARVVYYDLSNTQLVAVKEIGEADAVAMSRAQSTRTSFSIQAGNGTR